MTELHGNVQAVEAARCLLCCALVIPPIGGPFEGILRMKPFRPLVVITVITLYEHLLWFTAASLSTALCQLVFRGNAE